MGDRVSAVQQPPSGPAPATPSPYVVIDRERWSALRATTPLTLDDDDLARLRGLGEPIDLAEVEEVYLPLSRLLSLQVTAAHERHRATSTFLGEASARVPFVIGVAGSVAVGKSTTSRVLRELLARWPHHPRVELVTTDGFLLPNAELDRRGLLGRKGFPESYDQRGLLRFLAGGEVGQPGGRGAGLLAPGLRRRPRRVTGGPQPRHPDRRGAERAAAAAPAGRRPVPDERVATTSTSRCTSTRRPPTPAGGTSSGSSGCGAPPSPTRRRTSTGSRRCPTTRPARPRSASGPRSTSRTCCRTSSRPAAGPTLVLEKGAGPRRTPGAAAQALRV